MNLRLRTLALLTLLTMLQVIAPFLHAHVGGQFVRTGAHIHLVTKAASAEAASAALPTLLADAFHASESPEISLGVVIERRFLMAASADVPTILASPWPAVGRQSVVWLPVAPTLESIRQRKDSALPPPATAPPYAHA